MTEFDNIPYADYKSFLRWLSRKKVSFKHELELLSNRETSTEAVRQRIIYLQHKIKEIEYDYKQLDHRNFES